MYGDVACIAEKTEHQEQSRFAQVRLGAVCAIRSATQPASGLG